MVAVRRRVVRPAEAVGVVGGAALLAGSWIVVAASGSVPEWEAHLFRQVNDLPNALWRPLQVPMQLGSLAGSLAIVAGAAVVTRNRRLTLAALVSNQAAYWGAKVVKASVSRERPGNIPSLVGVHLHEHARGLGYLSGHTAVACALATTLGPELPLPWKIVAALLAVTVGFARIYAGAHLPLDVVGGAGLGIFAGTLTRWAFGLGGEGVLPRDR